MNYLDLLLADQPGYYSFPAQFSASCPDGKPYHFWNSAYLSRQLKSEGYADRASSVSMFIAGELYDIFSNTLGREPLQVFRDPVYSVHNNALREDIVSNTQGAIYGAWGEAANLDGDLAMRDMLNHAKDLKLTKDEIKAFEKNPLAQYDSWRKIMAPDAVLKSLWNHSL